ncbi:HEXXH motif domain-containing protein [Frankia sp. AgB32]|uniref:HEXXH motif domain-containing protein n=1 Tax=Frankia sp. AgB32 TaxID=631119 RepID=UPI0020100371|nr:HEXXH motif domain-containing protein [Frankia sp. AgB32]MCK9893020.1 HEXXH motif domain-containing protein [Frankia sp. AgB32]
MKFHRLTAADLDELACGRGGAELVHRLRVTQLSRRLLVLRAFLDDSADLAPEAVERSGLNASFEVLVAAQRLGADVVDDLLLSPGFGLWAMHCLRRLHGTVTAPTPLEDELAGLGAFAVAAALRSGLDVELTLLINEHGLVLPTLGRYRGGPTGRVRVRTGRRLLTIYADDPADGPPVLIDWRQPEPPGDVSPASAGWQPLLLLGSEADGERIDLHLDFHDPSRHRLDLPMADEVGPDATDLWQQRIDEGWRILCRYDPSVAEALAAGLTTIYPLRSTSDANELSASAGEAFGAVAMTLPKDGLSCAAALIHEFQHNKLSALLDLVILAEPVEGRLFYAPWRADPRPLLGLLQGAYAYLGLTEFWDFQRRVLTDSPFAHFEFARWREEVWRVLVAMRLSGVLTPLGLRFVDGMRTVIGRHRRAAIPAEPQRLARQVSADTWTTWRLTNLEPAADLVAGLADAWTRGQPPGGEMRVDAAVRPGRRGLVHNARLNLVYVRLNEPKVFAAAREGVPGVLEQEYSLADRAQAFGDVQLAAEAYKAGITDDPDDLTAWAGLALCRRETGPARSRVLVAHPELVRAVHRGIEERTGERVDPDTLTSWLPEPVPAGTAPGTAMP